MLPLECTDDIKICSNLLHYKKIYISKELSIQREFKMTLALSLMGIVLFLISKKFMLSAESGKALWSSYLEVPVDANLIGFMLGIATISQMATQNKYASITILGLILLMQISILIWKYSCSLMSERNGTVYFSNPKRIMMFTVLNVLLACSAIYLPIALLGAKP